MWAEFDCQPRVISESKNSDGMLLNRPNSVNMPRILQPETQGIVAGWLVQNSEANELLRKETKRGTTLGREGKGSTKPVPLRGRCEGPPLVRGEGETYGEVAAVGVFRDIRNHTFAKQMQAGPGRKQPAWTLSATAKTGDDSNLELLKSREGTEETQLGDRVVGHRIEVPAICP